MEPKRIIERLDKLKGERSTFESHWQEVADYLMPSREFTRQRSAGQKRMMPWIYNTAPILAAEQLAGGLHGMLTSPAVRWFALRPENRALREDEAAKRWFDDTTERMYEAFNAQTGGFGTAAHEAYLDLAAFGTAVIFIGDRGPRGPLYLSRPLAECFIAENADGEVDTLFRSYSMPAREVLRIWPKTATKKVRDAAEKTPDMPFALVHAVWPDDKSEGWLSQYCLREEQATLEDGRFKEFPYAVARWSKRSGEVYGNGPGMNALPDVKLLNKLEEHVLKGLARVVNPAVQMPDDGFLSPLNIQPGGVNVYRAGTREQDRIQEVSTGARPDVGQDAISAIEGRVRSVFYVDWLALPTRPQMTATEVLQRRDEQLRLLGPMVSRMQAELLSPLIRRSFRILWENNLLSMPPEQAGGAAYGVDYLSPIALAQRATDAEAVMRWVAEVASMQPIDPKVINEIDAPAVARLLRDRRGVPMSVARSPATAAEMGAAQDQAAEAAMNADAAQVAAGVAKQGADAMATIQGMQQGASAVPAAAVF